MGKKKKPITDAERRRRGISVRLKRPEDRKKVREYGLKELKKGTHPQQWRAPISPSTGKPVLTKWARLGPMGELGDDIIIEIFLTAKIKEAFNKTGLNETTVTSGLFDLFEDVVDNYLLDKVETWVPKDTGALRRAIKSVLNRSITTVEKITTMTPFRITIGTPNIPYAKVVNKMPTPNLQHPGSLHNPGEKSYRRKGKTLDDPKANTGWYGLLLLNGRTRATQAFNRFLTNTIVPEIRGTAPYKKNPKQKARTFFKVRYK